MKKKLMMMVAAVAAALGAWAETETVGGYTWTYRINGDTAEIYKGSYSAAISPSPTDAVTIPSTLGGKPVTSIGGYAFYGCSGLTSVTIPDGVTSIGTGAFSSCSGLESVHITDLAKWCGISFRIPKRAGSYGPLYYAKNLYLNGEKVSTLTIPDGVTSIGQGAFFGYSGLTSVTIPDSVTSIGAMAFEGCTNLTSVTIPNSVTSIGEGAFCDCSGLTSVTIPDSVTSIGDDAFYGCSGLTSVTIPNSVTSIGSSAFYECSGLTNVVIGSSVTSIGDDAFDLGCLRSITLPARLRWWYYEGAGDYEDDGSWNGSVTFYDIVNTVVFDAAGGTSGIASKTWRNDDNAILGVMPSAWRDGYVFTGWYTAAEGGEQISGLTAVTGNTTYYAHWTQNAPGSSSSVVTTVVQQVAAPYALTDVAADRAIAEVTVDADCAIDSFVLKDGEVYDSVLYVSNTADNSVKLTLPSGFIYKTYKGTKPLEIPAKSQCMLSITRVADKTFLVSREELEDVQ